MNINILGIGELKLMGWENLIQVTIISTTVGKNPLKEMELPSWSTKSLKCSTSLQSQKDRMNSVCFQDKTFNITVIQVYALTFNAEEAEVE